MGYRRSWLFRWGRRNSISVFVATFVLVYVTATLLYVSDENSRRRERVGRSGQIGRQFGEIWPDDGENLTAKDARTTQGQFVPNYKELPRAIRVYEGRIGAEVKQIHVPLVVKHAYNFSIHAGEKFEGNVDTSREKVKDIISSRARNINVIDNLLNDIIQDRAVNIAVIDKALNDIIPTRAVNIAVIDKVEDRSQKPKSCNFDSLSVDDRNIDEEFNNCTFPEVTSDDTFDLKINKLDQIKLPFLRNYENPCWYEALPKENKYRGKVHMFWERVKQSFDRMVPILQQRRKRGHFWRLRCLPKVYIIGLGKCGVTDIHFSLAKHPHVTHAASKEPFYWSRDRWKWNSPITDYLDLFDEAAERIRKLTTSSANDSQIIQHPMITVDGSVNYLYEFGGIDELPGNDDINMDPVHVLPHLLRNLVPKRHLKVIVTLRNPTERLYSAYIQRKAYDVVSPKEFHDLVSHQIRKLNSCVVKYTLRTCVYREGAKMKSNKVDLFTGIYAVFLKDWLHVIPDLKVTRWEDYKVNKRIIFMDMVKYIGLETQLVTNETLNSLIDEDSPDQVKMLPETEKVLNNFYAPYNLMLAELLSNKNFKFKD